MAKLSTISTMTMDLTRMLAMLALQEVRGDVVEVEGVEVAVDVMEEVVAPVDVVTTR
jgi:hypothetical protein